MLRGRHRVSKVLALVGLALLSVPPGVAQARPTFGEARGAIHVIFANYAASFDGRLIVGPCARRGKRSVVCRARITGREPERLRVVVWDGVYKDGEEQVMIRAFVMPTR